MEGYYLTYMLRRNKAIAGFFMGIVCLATSLLTLTSSAMQEALGLPPESEHAKESRRIFATVHCEESDPRSIEAFSGCWKVAAVSASPTDELRLGMRMSENRAQLVINSYGATQRQNSNNPRFCFLWGNPTVAPEPEVDFMFYSTAVYVMRDPQEVLQHALLGEEIAKLTPEQRKEVATRIEAIREFSRQGGKYIQTLFVQGPTYVWWDSDAEEDFLALPSSCEGWEKVEEFLESDRPAWEYNSDKP